jgi:N-acetylmuramoyl-L-alanine amidase
MPREINLIVIHCSATPNGDSLFRGKSGQPGFKTALDVIDEMHAQRGFKRSGPTSKTMNPRHQSVGYHFIIACNGAVYTGRHLDEVGAHVQGHNAQSIGICLTGTDRFTSEQWHALHALLTQLNTSLRIPLRTPTPVVARGKRTLAAGVCGHRDLSPDLNGDNKITSNEWVKTCPGFDVAWYLGGFTPPLAAIYSEQRNG